MNELFNMISTFKLLHWNYLLVDRPCLQCTFIYACISSCQDHWLQKKKTTSLLFACRLYSWCNDRSLKLLLNWFEIHLKIYEDSVKKKTQCYWVIYTFFPVLVSFVFLPFFRNFTIGWCFSHIFPSFSSFSCPSLSYSFSFQCSSISFIRVHHLPPRPSLSFLSIFFFINLTRSPFFSDTTQIFPQKMSVNLTDVIKKYQNWVCM